MIIVMFFFQPPSDYKNHLIDASKYHTASNVSLGNDKQKYYTTTIQEYFPQRERVYKKRYINTCASDIPLNYYGKLCVQYFSLKNKFRAKLYNQQER